MRSLIKAYPIPSLLLVALVWQLLIVFFLQLHLQDVIFPDSQNYLRASKAFFSSLSPHPHRPIGMSLVTGIPLVFNAADATIFSWSWLLNTLCWLATIALLFKIINKTRYKKIAFSLALTYVFCVGPIVLNMHLLSETYYVFLLVLSFYCLQLYQNKQTAKFLFIALSLIIISWLFRPVSKYIVVLMLVIYAKDIFGTIKNKYSLLVFGSFLFLLIQCGLNYKAFGNFKVSYMDSYTAYLYITSQAEAKKRDVPRQTFSEKRYEEFMKLPLKKRHKKGMSDFKPSLTFEYLENKKDTNLFNITKPLFNQLSRIQNILLSLLGFIIVGILCYKTLFVKSYLIKDHKLEIFLGLTIAYLVIVSGISFGQGDRFHLVVYPLIFILLSRMGLFRKLRVS